MRKFLHTGVRCGFLATKYISEQGGGYCSFSGRTRLLHRQEATRICTVCVLGGGWEGKGLVGGGDWPFSTLLFRQEGYCGPRVGKGHRHLHWHSPAWLGTWSQNRWWQKVRKNASQGRPTAATVSRQWLQPELGGRAHELTDQCTEALQSSAAITHLWNRPFSMRVKQLKQNRQTASPQQLEKHNSNCRQQKAIPDWKNPLNR